MQIRQAVGLELCTAVAGVSRGDVGNAYLVVEFIFVSSCALTMYGPTNHVRYCTAAIFEEVCAEEPKSARVGNWPVSKLANFELRAPDGRRISISPPTHPPPALAWSLRIGIINLDLYEQC